MGFIAPAVPALIQGGAAIGSALLGRRAAKQQFQRSPEEQNYLSQTGQAGQTLLGQGQQLFNLGTPGIQASQDYFGKLLSGNRAAQAQAVGSGVANLTDVYRGAARGVGRSGLVGSARDMALADLNRDRAGATARLVSGIQPMAAQQLAQTGLGTVGAAIGPTLGASNIFGQLAGEARSQRENANAAQAQAGKSAGAMIFDMLQGNLGQRGSKRSAPSLTGSVPSLPIGSVLPGATTLPTWS